MRALPDRHAASRTDEVAERLKVVEGSRRIQPVDPPLPDPRREGVDGSSHAVLRLHAWTLQGGNRPCVEKTMSHSNRQELRVRMRAIRTWG